MAIEEGPTKDVSSAEIRKILKDRDATHAQDYRRLCKERIKPVITQGFIDAMAPLHDIYDDCSDENTVCGVGADVRCNRCCLLQILRGEIDDENIPDIRLKSI